MPKLGRCVAIFSGRWTPPPPAGGKYIVTRRTFMGGGGVACCLFVSRSRDDDTRGSVALPPHICDTARVGGRLVTEPPARIARLADLLSGLRVRAPVGCIRT